jgi:hypothetical protein
MGKNSFASVIEGAESSGIQGFSTLASTELIGELISW